MSSPRQFVPSVIGKVSGQARRSGDVYGTTKIGAVSREGKPPRCAGQIVSELRRRRGLRGSGRDLGAIGDVEVLLHFRVVEVVLGHDRITGRDGLLRRCLLGLQVVDRHHDALVADVVRVLADQEVDDTLAEVLDLLRTGIEADNLDLTRLVSLLDRGRGALGAEQVRAEDTGQIRVACSLAAVCEAAVVGSSLLKSTPMYLMFG